VNVRQRNSAWDQVGLKFLDFEQIFPELGEISRPDQADIVLPGRGGALPGSRSPGYGFRALG